jgi:MraZ protein
MSSFKGSYKYSVDAKGRVNLPAKLRKYVSAEARDTFVIMRGFEQCLYIYPQDEWVVQEQKLRATNTYVPQGRLLLRVMLEYAEEVQLDTQARIMIPPDYREYANIQDEVQIVGTLDKIEIWNPNVYEEYKKKIDKTREEIAAQVMGPKE